MKEGRVHSARSDPAKIGASTAQAGYHRQRWCDNEARMRMLKRAIQQTKMPLTSASAILQRITRKRMGLTKGDDEWDAATNWAAKREAKGRLLENVTGSYTPWTGQQQSCPQQQWPHQQWHQGWAPQMPSLQQPWPPPPPPPPGAQGAKGGKGGKGGRVREPLKTPLDTPQKSRCSYLRGPFAPEAERYECKVQCKHCTAAGVVAYHSGSWECDQQPWTNRSKFLKGEVDRWGLPTGARPVPPG